MSQPLLRLGCVAAPQHRAVAAALAERLAGAHALVALPVPPRVALPSALVAALAEGRVDAALLPLAGLPPELPAEAVLACVLPREEARELVLGAPPEGWGALAPGTRVRCVHESSARQVRRLAPHLAVEATLGDGQHGLAQWQRGEVPVAVLPGDSLEPVGAARLGARPLDPSEVLPPPCAGAWGVLVRADDASSEERIGVLRDLRTAAAVTAERAAAAAWRARVGEGAGGVLAALATCRGGGVHVRARWLAPASTGPEACLEAHGEAPLVAAASAGERAAALLAGLWEGPRGSLRPR